ncbi:hypothetical protein C8F04DRAFT_1078815, partial [Mycena alexandri]
MKRQCQLSSSVEEPPLSRSRTTRPPSFSMAHPEHFVPMREEAERFAKQESWTKLALNNMVKIYSFLRESQRPNTFSPLNMVRKVVSKDGFQLSNGAFFRMARTWL